MLLSSCVEYVGLVSADVCEQALYEHRPSDVDVQPTEAWLAVMEQAHCNMSRLFTPNYLLYNCRLFRL